MSDNANSPQQRQLNLQEDEHQPKSLIQEPSMQCLPAYAPIRATSLTSIPSTKPSLPPSLGTLKEKTISEKARNQLLQSGVPSSLPSRVNKKNWEEHYL